MAGRLGFPEISGREFQVSKLTHEIYTELD
jgi:hypothetical protein